MKRLPPIIIALFLIAPITFAEEAEVKEARAATAEHNTDIKSAKERLEAQIIRAEQEYARQAIRSKMAYNKDLQKAKRTALQNDDTDNATAIVKQIERVEKQIEHLKEVLAGRTRLDPADNKDKEPKETKSKIDKRLVGKWTNMRNTCKHDFTIYPDGRLVVTSNSHSGHMVGTTHKIQKIGKRYVVTFNGWNRGITDVLEITDEGLIIKAWDSMNNLKSGKDPNPGNTWSVSFDHRKPLEEPKEEEPKEEPKDENIDFEEPKDDTTNDDPDGFFGIPLE